MMSTSTQRIVILAVIVTGLLTSGDGLRVFASPRAARASLVQSPIAFEANRGQFDPGVRFVSRTKGYTLGLTDQGATIVLNDLHASNRRDATLQLRFDGARHRQPFALERLPGAINYLIGNDATLWQTGIPLYARVEYDEVYPGVDVAYYGTEGMHEYDLVVAPGADPAQIAMRVTGAERIDRDANGGLRLVTFAGAVTLRTPTVYQMIGGERTLVDARYALAGDSIRFDLGVYDATATLVIDPQLVYGTFLGGTGNGVDQANGVAVDAAGNAYIVGTSETTDFPTQSPLQGQRRGQSDAVVTKLSPEGMLIYSTYLGGASFDYGVDIAVRDDGTTYVLGDTTSDDFPVPNSGARRFAGVSDSVVVAISPSGASIVNGAFIGGSDAETAGGLELTQRSNGDATLEGGVENRLGDLLFVYGATKSPDFPTLRPAQDRRVGTRDGYVVVLERQTLQPQYAT